MRRTLHGGVGGEPSDSTIDFEVKAILKKCDKNNDGTITVDEFESYYWSQARVMQ